MTKAPCDVLVERIGPTDGEVDSILLSTAGGPHAELAAEVCRAIARTNDATVHVMNVVAADAGERDREDAQRRVNSTAAALGDDELVTTSVREGDDVAATIVAATEAFDLTVIGATREGLLQQLVFGAIPETVGRDAASTVIMAKRDLGIISWVTRWFKRRRDDYHVPNSGGE